MNHSTHFLYGITPQAIENMKYYEALKHMAKEGDKLHKSLSCMRRNSREDIRMHYVAEELERIRTLLDERTSV